MNRMIILISYSICLSLFVSGIALGESATAYVHVKNRANKYINPDGGVQMDGSNMSWKGTGLYSKDASEGYRQFWTKESSESKSKLSKVTPPKIKIVTIRFSRN